MGRSGALIVESLFNNSIQQGLLTGRFEQGRIGLLFAVLGAEISYWEYLDEENHNEHYLTTAIKDENIEKMIQPLYGRIVPTTSDVILRIAWEPTMLRTDTVIPKGYVFETAEENPRQYFSTEKVKLYAWKDYVDVLCRSINPGTEMMVAPNELCIMNPHMSGIVCTNPEPSWGGHDEESVASARDHALATRYSMVRGTVDSFSIGLLGLGLEPYQYNLVDNAFDNGSMAVYVDTIIDEYIKEITDYLKQEKAEGIFLTCEKSIPLEYDFQFSIKVSKEYDLLPEERDQLKDDISTTFQEFVIQNGVGKKLVLSKAVHYLYDELLKKYELYDIHISTDNFPTKKDLDGNLIIEKNEAIKVQNISIDIVTG